MPYTPPTPRSPAVSTYHSPIASRRSSQASAALSTDSPTPPPRPELPRSASYSMRHRRSTSVKTTSFASTSDTSEPTPPGTADSEASTEDDFCCNPGGKSIRQSPPASADEMPRGAVMSPPESTVNSSDDDEDALEIKRGRPRQLKNLAELEAAISVIEQTRLGSPIRSPEEGIKGDQTLTLVLPGQEADAKPIGVHMEPSFAAGRRRVTPSRPATEGCGFFDLGKSSSSSRSASDSELSESELTLRRKPSMVRKKSGELVRPALRTPSSRRRPLSMPGTPTFGGKAVHFDAHLEHVRHFLQVDRPLAVSAGSSPVESAYESDGEFPFGENEGSAARSPPFEWEIVLANFPAETAERLRMPVRVERVFLSADNKTLVGSIAAANLAYSKTIVARFTLDYWKTTSEVVAEYKNDVRRQQISDGYDRFNFSLNLADQANLEAKTMFFCVKYCVNGQEYWDNNDSTNFQIDFKKKPKPVKGKKGMPGAASRPANALPRSNKKSPTVPTPKARPRSLVAFDDFENGFDAKYDFTYFGQPVHDYLGESPTNSVRLKGVQSAVNVSSSNMIRRGPKTSPQAFGNRYDFGASLTAARQAANTGAGERSGLSQKTLAMASKQPENAAAANVECARAINNNSVKANQSKAVANRAAKSSEGGDSPSPDGLGKPDLRSQSYNELLDKYCFFGSVKGSPQLSDGTARGRSGQHDGSNDVRESRSTTPSPPMPQSPPHSIPIPSGSPAPMTGFVTGMSPVYPFNMHSSFLFNEAHAATAIRG